MDTDRSPGQKQRDPVMTRGLLRWARRGLQVKVMVAVILFAASGRLDWVWAWAYVALFLAFDIATALLIIPKSPELLLERSAMQQGTKSWDKVVFPLASGFIPLAYWLVAGLDRRFGWTASFPLWLQAAAAVVTALGYAITLWAMVSNAFFSATVRIQTERGHTVVTGGPYRGVRHPGYAGALLFTLGAPLMLGSWWALIPAGLSAALYIVRTALEDRTLQAELEGYKEYAQQTRYRLLPGVW